MGNDYCEAFNGNLRDEWLNGNFRVLKEATVVIEQWCKHFTQSDRTRLSCQPSAPQTSVSTLLQLDRSPGMQWFLSHWSKVSVRSRASRASTRRTAPARKSAAQSRKRNTTFDDVAHREARMQSRDSGHPRQVLFVDAFVVCHVARLHVDQIVIATRHQVA